MNNVNVDMNDAISNDNSNNNSISNSRNSSSNILQLVVLHHCRWC